MTDITPTEQQLLVQLGSALAAADPVPERVLEAAKATFTWRTIDAELAQLVFDSATEPLAGVRGGESTRQMTFQAPGLEIEIDVQGEAERKIVGQLVPPQEAQVELRSGGTVQTLTSDALGRFTFEDVPVGPVSLRCRLDTDTVVATEWTLV